MRPWLKPSRLVTSFLLNASLLFAVRLAAQTTSSGALTGVVTDQTNAVVPSAHVDIKDLARGATQSTSTDRDGLYHLFFLAPGRYSLIISHDGFREERRVVDVLLGPPVTVNVALRIVTATSEIKVSDVAPLIHADNGDVSETMGQNKFPRRRIREMTSLTLCSSLLAC